MAHMFRKGNRLIGTLLVLVMVLSTLAGVLPYTALEVRAAGNEKTITGLGVGAITDPIQPATWNASWSGSYVYYGKYDGKNPTKYRVLDKDSSEFGVTKSLLLDSDSSLYQAQFDTDGVTNQGGEHPNDWQYSDVKAGLNGASFLNKSGNFTEGEKVAIASSNKANANQGDTDLPEYHVYAPLKGEKIFLLDSREATRLSYGYHSNADSMTANRKKSGEYWLRSRESFHDDDYSQVESVRTGAIINRNVRSSLGVSPAFNVDSKNIMFSSLVNGTAGEPGAEYKLTLVDSSLGVTTGNVERDGNTIKVSVDKTGSPTQYSVVITDGEWTANGWSQGATNKYYRKLTLNNTFIESSGIGSFELPEEFVMEDGWKAYVIAEKINDGNATDYASAPQEITIPQLPSTSIKMDNATLMKGDSAWTADGDVLKLTAGNYKLESDINTDKTISVEGNVTLDLNGYGINHNKNTIGDVIRVNPSGTLTINDTKGSNATHYYYIDEANHIGVVCDESAYNSSNAITKAPFTEGYITGGNWGNYGSGSGIDNDGTLIINGGIIIGNNTYNGGGVHNNGTLTLNDGSIIGNYSNQYGAGVFHSGTGEFTMNGGDIRYNYANVSGCGVCVDEGSTFNMNDGTISDNISKDTGGVFCRKNATFTMTGGSVINNKGGEDYTGIGIYLFPNSTFNLSGKSEIYGNVDANGKEFNVLLENSSSYITVTGELLNTVPIGIRKQVDSGDFTNTASENLKYNDISKFKAEGQYHIQKNSDGQLELAADYKVTYDVNGGEGAEAPVDDNIYSPGAQVTVKDKPQGLKKDYYYFSGWNTQPDGNGQGYSAGSTFDINSNTVLYANWQMPTEANVPRAKGQLTYTGEPQDLITPPREYLGGYTIKYSVDDGDYSTNIPQATDVGIHTVKVRYVNDNNQDDYFDGADILVPISLVGTAAVSKKISELPDPNSVTIEHKDEIEDVKNAYDMLTDVQKSNIANDYKEKLTRDIIALVMLEVTAKGGTYSGEAIELINAPTTELPTGYTIKYAVTDDGTQPEDDTFADAVPVRTEIGTYYVWYKVTNGNEDATNVKKVTSSITKNITPSPTPTPTPTPEEDYDVPVENKSRIDIKAHISDGVATLADVLYEDVDTALRDRGEELPEDLGDKLVIDISEAKQTVTGIDIGTQTLHNIAGAVSNYPEVEAIEIRLTNATVALDVAAAESVVYQAQGDTIRLMVNDKKESSLNSAQRNALSPFSYRSPFEVYFESDGDRISDFNGGEATVSIKHDIPQGKSANYFHLYYLPEDGKLTRRTTWYENGMFTFKTGHFSDYAIVYDETDDNNTLPAGMEWTDSRMISETDPEMGDAVIAVEVLDNGVVYRLYNPNSGEHMYTKNPKDVAQCVSWGWIHEEDSDFVAYGYDKEGCVPVYRLFNPTVGLHHYTIDRNEATHLVSAGAFNYEGVAFYAMPSASTEGTLMYRLFNPYEGFHLFTTKAGDYRLLESIGWIGEGAPFRVEE